VKKRRFVLTPAPADEKTPGGSERMHQRSQSSRSLRLVWTNAVSVVRKISADQRSAPRLPPRMT